MKTRRLLMLLLFVVVGLQSCTKDKETPKTIEAKGIYIVNYGKSGDANGGISVYDEENEQITSNTAYADANGRSCGSNIQSVGVYDGTLYFMSNAGDKIDIVDANTMKALAAPISEGIVKPRYFVAKDDYGYVSCWGGDDWGVFAAGNIAIIDLENNSLSKSIAMPGGAEGLAIVGDKLYGAVYARNQVFVMDLATEQISYIDTKAMPQHLVVDADNNLWVSVTSTYSAPYASTEVGLQQIITATGKVGAFVNCPSIGSNGLIEISKDKSTVYFVGGEAWLGETSVFAVNLTDKVLVEPALITGEAFYGLGYNAVSEKIYVCISKSFDGSPGALQVYSKTGELLDEQTTGATPQDVAFNYAQ